ncbi:hypothetical protein [Asticcacaulis sp.]|uniref:hypothetical protein n=1 Tax=Asticcacaulis sp. TaxID=1872648 RepID=UPI002602CF14|nr:hypothetical protein [Asticcacaulis sp.]
MSVLANQPDADANSLVASSKGMLEWLAKGYTVSGAIEDKIILTGERGSIVLCRVSRPALRMSNGSGSNAQQGPKEDALDVSRCYAPRGQ